MDATVDSVDGECNRKRHRARRGMRFRTCVELIGGPVLFIHGLRPTAVSISAAALAMRLIRCGLWCTQAGWIAGKPATTVYAVAASRT
jgi:hypothetical protein